MRGGFEIELEHDNGGLFMQMRKLYCSHCRQIFIHKIRHGRLVYCPNCGRTMRADIYHTLDTMTQFEAKFHKFCDEKDKPTFLSKMLYLMFWVFLLISGTMLYIGIGHFPHKQSYALLFVISGLMIFLSAFFFLEMGRMTRSLQAKS